MNVYLMVDIEGISGVYTRDHIRPDAYRANEGRDYMTADINACAAACKEAGALRVYVHDCHWGPSCFVRWDGISDDVDYVISGTVGWGNRFCGLEDCDAVILLGYHAMTGTEGAILSHTMDRDTVYRINGMVVGETGIDAGIVGDANKPVIMVSGDDKLCAEAAALLPGVVTCEVKRGLTFEGGMLLPPTKAHAKIRECTLAAIKAYGTTPPLVYERPVHMSYQKIGDKLHEAVGDTVEQAFGRLFNH